MNFMNNRIKELAEQAGFVYEPIMDTLWFTGPPNVIMMSPLLEKFYDLIIKDCAQTLQTKGEIYGAYLIEKEYLESNDE